MALRRYRSCSDMVDALHGSGKAALSRNELQQRGESVRGSESTITTIIAVKLRLNGENRGDAGARKNKKVLHLQDFLWRARQDSNLRPSDS
jgi:hypothetical protein